MTKVILFNSPKGSGKSELSRELSAYIWTEGECTQTLRFKDKLFELTKVMFNINNDKFFDIYEDRIKKETPRAEFVVTYSAFINLSTLIDIHIEESRWIEEGKVMLSCREAMIYVSEILIKPSFGEMYFGESLVKGIDSRADFVIDDSTGFLEELIPVVEAVGVENILIVKVKRDGHTEWGADSRGWVSYEGVAEVEVDNNGTIEQGCINTTDAVVGWLNSKENK